MLSVNRRPVQFALAGLCVTGFSSLGTRAHAQGVGNPLPPVQAPLPPLRPLPPGPSSRPAPVGAAPQPATPQPASPQPVIATPSPAVRPAPAVGAPPPGASPNWSQVAVPGACLAVADSKWSNACYVLDARDLLSRMQTGLSDAGNARLLAEMLLVDGGRVLVVHFGGTQLDSRLSLVRALYNAERQFFAQMADKIAQEMTTNPARVAQLTEDARRHGEQVQQLKENVFAENDADIQASSTYLENYRSSTRIHFRCSDSCHSLIDAATGLDVFD